MVGPRRPGRGFPDGEFPVWFFEVAGETVWGATARTLMELLCIVLGVPVPRPSGPLSRPGAAGPAVEPAGPPSCPGGTWPGVEAVSWGQSVDAVSERSLTGRSIPIVTRVRRTRTWLS